MTITVERGERSDCRLETVKGNEEQVNAQFESARKKAKKGRSQFEKIKTERLEEKGED